MTNDTWNHQFAELPGIRVHFVREGSGAPLVLLHGWPEFWYVWHRNIRSLAANFDIITPDLRGFGDTEKPDGKLTVDVLVEDLFNLADHLGVDRFGMVTHDIGAHVAQAAARRAPERLFGLFFFDCPYPGIGRRWADPGHLMEIWYQSFHQENWAVDLVGHSRDTCAIYFRHFLGHWAANPHVFDNDLDAWVDNFMKPGNLQGGFDWYAAVNEARLTLMREGAPKMTKINVPTRVLWGAEDPVLKAEWADRLTDYFSDIRIDIAEGAGHFVSYERPDLTNSEIVAFFEDILER